MTDGRVAIKLICHFMLVSSIIWLSSTHWYMIWNCCNTYFVTYILIHKEASVQSENGRWDSFVLRAGSPHPPARSSKGPTLWRRETTIKPCRSEFKDASLCSQIKGIRVTLLLFPFFRTDVLFERLIQCCKQKHPFAVDANVVLQTILSLNMSHWYHW